MLPPSRSCLFFIFLSVRVSCLPKELHCYLSARVRAFLSSSPPFSLIKKAPASIGSAAHTHTDAISQLHSYNSTLSLTRIYKPIIAQTCNKLSPTSPPGTAVHTPRPFPNTTLSYQLLWTVYNGHKRCRWHDMFCHDSLQIKYLKLDSPAGRTSNYSNTHTGVVLQLSLQSRPGFIGHSRAFCTTKSIMSLKTQG